MSRNDALQSQVVPSIYKSAEAYEQLMAWYDNALRHLTVPYQTRTVGTRHGETYVIAAGDNVPDRLPIVLLHGLGANAAFWWPMINELATSHYVIAPDIVGTPGRSDTRHAPYRGHAYSDWLLDVLDALEIERAHMVAHSLGGRLLIKFGGYGPGIERLGRMVLLAPAGIWPLGMGAFAKMAGYGVTPMASPRKAARILTAFNLAPDSGLAQERFEDIVDLFTIYIGAVRKELHIILSFGLPKGALRAVSVPTLLLMGEHEPLYHPRKTIKRARKLMPDVQAAMVAGTGHVLTWERPAEVASRIVGFLEIGN